MSGFLVALEFLTRIPSPRRRRIDDTELGPSTRWFPLVGALLGGIVGLVDFGLGFVATPEIRAIVAVATLALLTGGLHLDGLMDSCDGLLAFTAAERRLEIMRDSRVGSFAIVGATTLLLVKYAAFLSLPGPHRFMAFVIIGGLSRWAMVYAIGRYPSARSEGLAHTFRVSLSRGDLTIATFFALVVATPAGPAGVTALAVAWLATVLLARYTQSKIPGLTGDVYGAICEIVEVAIAIILPPIWTLTG